MEQRKISISEISEILNITPSRDSDVIINGLNLCNRKTEYESIISYATSERFIDSIKLNKSMKSLIVNSNLYNVFKDELNSDIVYFISEEPESAFYKLHNCLYDKTDFYDKFRFEPIIGENCKIHKTAVIEDGVIIGNNVVIGPNSVIRSGAILKDNVSVGCCSVIGSEGFQGIKIDGKASVIPHAGGLVLEENVWIGDNVTVGNMLFEGHVIVGKNTKIDNHVHIAHNCLIGENCFITASCLLMGSTVLDNNVWLAPNVLTMNKVHLYDNSFVGSMSLVTKDVHEGDLVVGIPAKKWEKGGK